MNVIDLADLADLRHPNSWGTVTIDATPAGITASHRTETIDDAIGLVATALSALLDRRAEAEELVNQWLPETIKG